MPKVVTFSVFFPSLSSSSAVWAHASTHQEHSNAASIFFMVAPFERAIVCLSARARNAQRAAVRFDPVSFPQVQSPKSAHAGLADSEVKALCQPAANAR